MEDWQIAAVVLMVIVLAIIFAQRTRRAFKHWRDDPLADLEIRR